MTEMDSRHWATTDGHRFTSIPAPVPADWKKKYTDLGLTYVSGPYTIRRDSYSRTGYSYELLRDGDPIGFLYSRLRDAKDHAVRNAEGRDVVNVA